MISKTTFFSLALIALLCLWSGIRNNNDPFPDDQTMEIMANPYPETDLATIIKLNDISKDELSVHIYKSQYKLCIVHADSAIKTFPMVLGFNPVDEKLMQGDGCTPEGVFHIVDKYPHASWKYFIWIDYPTAESYKKHKEAKAAGLIPKDAKIGGEIGIHGTPDGYDHAIRNGDNWTLGCISLTRKSIEEIYPFISKKTDIVIYH